MWSIYQPLVLIALILCCLLTPTFSQENGGARSLGLGNATAAINGEWSLFQNSAGIAETEQLALISFVSNNFSIPGFRTLGFGIIWPSNIGAIGFRLNRFGDELYSEQLVSLSYSNRFGLASLGIDVKYKQFDISVLGSKGVLQFDIGGIAELTPELRLGLHLSNITQSKIEGRSTEELPVVARMGISYIPTSELSLSIEVEKDLDFDPTFKIGLEYELMKSIYTRTGINTNPEKFFFGLGFEQRHFEIDYALSHHPDLGQAHQISILFKPKSK